MKNSVLKKDTGSVLVRLPGPDPLQRALTRCDRCPLVCLSLWGAAEAAHVSQVHVHEGVGGAGGRKGGDTGVGAAVVGVIRRAVVRVGRVSVIAVRIGSVRSSSRGGIALRSSQTWLPIPNQHRHGHAPRRRRMMLPRRFQRLVLPLPFALVAAVLKPDLHLVRSEFEGGRQVLSLRGGQVALLLEAPLQLEDLRLGEKHSGSPPAPLLLHRPLRVALPALGCFLPGHQPAVFWAGWEIHRSMKLISL